MSEAPNGTISYRVARLEADVRELQKGQPAVIAERVIRLSADVENLRRDMNTEISLLDDKVDGMRKVLMGFLLTFAFTGITIVISTVVLLGAGG